MYYRDTAYGCNKRQPDSGCSAIGGHNRMLAILGTSEQCIASNLSDQNVALAHLGAQIHVTGSKGVRVRKLPVRIEDLLVAPKHDLQVS